MVGREMKKANMLKEKTKNFRWRLISREMRALLHSTRIF